MEQGNPQQAELIYAAGFFDGEGYVACYIGSGPNRNAIVYRVAIGQSSLDSNPPEVLSWLQGLFGGSISQQGKHNALAKLPHYQWCLSSSAARNFLAGIIPYLHVKKERAQFMLDMWEIRFDRPEVDRRLIEAKQRWGRAAATTKWSDAQELVAHV